MNLSGQTAICVASGPSLTQEDCELAAQSGYPIIAVNNSWAMARACSVLYASDYAWWQRYAPEIDIHGERWTNNRKAAKDFGLKLWVNNHGYNSGLAAIHLALWLGAARILLLGYDCKPRGTELHWHGAHQGCNNPNEISFKIWQKQYRQTPMYLRQKVINCSRDTAIACFPRMTLESALGQERKHA